MVFHTISWYHFMLSQGSVTCRPKVLFHAVPRYRFMLSQGFISCCPRVSFHAVSIVSCFPKVSFHDVQRYHFMPCKVLFYASPRYCFIPSQGIVFMRSQGIDSCRPNISFHAIPQDIISSSRQGIVFAFSENVSCPEVSFHAASRNPSCCVSVAIVILLCLSLFFLTNLLFGSTSKLRTFNLGLTATTWF
jgi:hypothetical protein